MSTASQILVIILSVFLAAFLILGITLVIYLIKLTNQIRRITKTAEKAVSGIDSVISNINKFSSPLAFANIVTKFAKQYIKPKK